MENKQKGTQKFYSEDHRIVTYVDNDVSVTELHDFYLSQKGYCVDLLLNAQMQEVENKKQWDKTTEEEPEEVQEAV